MTAARYALLIARNRDEAQARADHAYTTAVTRSGPDVARLCELSADTLTEQMLALHRAFAAMAIHDHGAICRTEAAILDAFQVRIGQLISGITAAGCA